MKKQNENTNFMVPEMKKKTVCFELYRIEKLTAASTCSLTVDLSLG